MRKIGVGIIGCGGIAVAKHIPNLLKDERAEIRGLCEPFNPRRMKDAQDQFALPNCRLYEDVDALLADERIDVVHVCTPNEQHAPLTIKALQAGKHVMCEKPMAISVEQAEAMANAALQTGKKLTVAANNRFRADSWYLKQLCERETLGEIYYARAYALRRRGVPTWGRFLSKEAQGGGPLIDIGVHALDLAMWLMDNYQPQEVLARTYQYLGKQTSPANPHGNWASERFEVEDFGAGMVTMANGATIYLEASWLLNLRDEKTAKVTLCGTKGGADMDDGLYINGEMNGCLYDQKIELNPPTIPFYPVRDPFGPELEIHRWLDAVEQDLEPVVRPAQMITVMRVIQAMYQSAEQGRAVRMEEIG